MSATGFAVQNWAVSNGWQVDQTVAWPDCECCDAWTWTDPAGREYWELGDWNEAPAVPDEVRKIYETATTHPGADQ